MNGERATWGLAGATVWMNWLWGTHGRDGSVVLGINAEPESLAPRCESVSLAGRFGAPFVMPYENDAPITLCRGLKTPPEKLWPDLKFFY
jgi:hypothetical protein